jgi:20S proteasome alpha/beta subunit
MGADSAGTAGSFQDVFNSPKLFKRGPFIIGGSGSYRGIQLLQFNVPLDEILPLDDYIPKKDVSPEAYMHLMAELIRENFKDNGLSDIENNVEGSDSCFLIGFRGRLFSVQYDFAVLESSNDYYAIGSGTAYALGSLHHSKDDKPLNRVLDALRCAEYYSSSVKGPFHILHLITDSNFEEYNFDE